MARTATEPLTSVSIRMPTADLLYLRDCFPSGGYQIAIKAIVREWIEARKAENDVEQSETNLR